MDEVRVAAGMAPGPPLALLHLQDDHTPEAKQRYLAGAQLPHIFKKKEEEEETSAFFFFFFFFFNTSTFATGFKDVKDTTDQTCLPLESELYRGVEERTRGLDALLAQREISADFGWYHPASIIHT